MLNIMLENIFRKDRKNLVTSSHLGSKCNPECIKIQNCYRPMKILPVSNLVSLVLEESINEYRHEVHREC